MYAVQSSRQSPGFQSALSLPAGPSNEVPPVIIINFLLRPGAYANPALGNTTSTRGAHSPAAVAIRDRGA